MFYSSKLHGLSVLCASFICAGALILTSCDEPSENTETDRTFLEIGNTAESSDVFVMTSLNDLISGFDYNLYEDSSCTDKALYNSASYFLSIGNDTYYFSNVSSYDSENKILYVEAVKNGQMNKNSDAFIFTSENKSYLTTLKITGISKIMTGGSVDIFENAFNSYDFKSAWNERSENYEKAGTVYYKVKTDFTTLKALPDTQNKTLYLLDGENKYVMNTSGKACAVKAGEYDIERPGMTQNLYQITSDEDYYYFGFSEISRESYNKALLDNYLGMPAICRIHFSGDLAKIYISDSLYLSAAKPYLEDQEWKENEYTLTETEPAAEESSIPSKEPDNLEDLQTLAKSLTGDYYWKDIANPDKSDNYYRFWFGTASSGTTPASFFKYLRLKGMVSGTNLYKSNTVSKPADDLYTDEIYTDEKTIAVYGHLATSSGNAAPKGAVYTPDENDTGKFAVWVVSADGVKASELFESLEACKKGPHTFTEYSWK